MLHATPPGWAHYLPGYGGFRVLTNAVLTHGSIQAGPLLAALAWLPGVGVAAALLFRHNMRVARGPGRSGTQPALVALTASKE